MEVQQRDSTPLSVEMSAGEGIPPRGEEEEHERFYDASDQPLEDFYMSREEVTEEEETSASLVSIFGSSPPQSLLRNELKFQRPPRPKERNKPSQIFPSADHTMLEQSEQVTETAKNMETMLLEEEKPLYMRIGGMLVLPVPVSGPLFIDEEADK